jgi:RND family efflux transporter MFP subunit
MFRVWLACPLLVLVCGSPRTALQPAPLALAHRPPARVADEAPAAAPEVTVVRPLAREVSAPAEFAGRTEAVASVEIRARVTGYLTKVNFKDGDEVKEGDVLFEIDPRPYRTDVERTEGYVARFEARLRRLEADYRRAKSLVTTGGMSREEYDRISGDVTETVAELRIARTNRESARLNLEFTRVTAPLAGRMGRPLVSPGALVKSDDTPLATAVAQERMYVSFDVDERTALRLRRSRPKEGAAVPVTVGLADEQGFPHKGTIDSADLRLDPQKGTLRLRAVVANEDGVLMPGLSARVRLPAGPPYKALLIPERAVVTDVGRTFVYVVKENVVERRAVELGARHQDLREVTAGVTAEDQVIVGSLEGVRNGMTVKPRAAPKQR